MKQIYKITLISSIAVFLLACSAKQNTNKNNIAKLDVKETCNVEKNSLQEVLQKAKFYNKIAIKNKVEFRKSNINNSQYIEAINEAISKNSNTVKLVDKNKNIQKLKINFATKRACTFAIQALQQQIQAKNTWRLAVPGDGFKY